MKILMVLTSHDRLGDTGKKTGFWLEEFAAPYYVFLDAGAHLAFGTDWPIAPLDPMLGVAAAVTRRTLDGKNPGGWHPEQKISVAEALAAYTSGSARAAFAENDKGTLAPGKLADFVLLSDDPLAIAPEKLETVRATRRRRPGPPLRRPLSPRARSPRDRARLRRWIRARHRRGLGSVKVAAPVAPAR